jgi:hypothetical protein
MAPALSLEDLRFAAAALGLAVRGGFYPEPKDGVPALPDGTAAATVVLFGFVGGTQWPVFAASAELADGRPNPLDRWSRRVIDAMGAHYGAVALYPTDGPPWLPFQQWARRAEPVHVSPLGVLIHPDYGLWHSYRGALSFRGCLSLPEADGRPSPCSSCIDKPCLHTCPVGAWAPGSSPAHAPGHFDRRACAGHVASKDGMDCFHLSCRARRSCPVGAASRYGATQSQFHMTAFLGGQNGASRQVHDAN